MINKKTYILALCILLVSTIKAEINDSIDGVALDSVTIKAYRYTSSVKKKVDGTFLWDVTMFNTLPKIMGNADPIRYTQMLPGIQTNSEYRGGVNIQGCDNSHNEILLNDIPIYNVNHLLGFFSAFNTSHFSELSVGKISTYKSNSNRIGGKLMMHSDTSLLKTLKGEFSLGLISSQGTFKIPLNRKMKLIVSSRQSYLNLLYGNWLATDKSALKYSFGDYNATVYYKINKNQSVLIDYYGGFDVGKFDDGDYIVKMKADWGNQMASVQWLYTKNNLKLKNLLYTTSYANRFSLSMSEILGKLPSSIYDIGYKGSIQIGRWNAGLDFIYHNIKPQNVNISGFYDVKDKDQMKQTPIECTFYGGYDYSINSFLHGSVGSKFTFFKSLDKNFYQIDPSVSLNYDCNEQQFSFNYVFGHQNLFQLGFSDIGLPTEFWFSADKTHAPQYAHSFVLSGSSFLLNRKFLLVADLFYRSLHNQIEYTGNVLDLLNKNYALQDNLIHGKGANYGFSVMFKKCTGNLTGWLSYTYTRARRKFNEFNSNKYFPASHERPHDFKAVITYKPSKNWDLGGVLVYASGTPFTAPQSFNFVNGNILIDYSDYNSNRLTSYLRCDLSVNYKWKSKWCKEQGVNLSFYNVFSQSNDLFWKIKISENKYVAYKPVSFLVKMLPSLSYYFKF